MDLLAILMAPADLAGISEFHADPEIFHFVVNACTILMRSHQVPIVLLLATDVCQGFSFVLADHDGVLGHRVAGASALSRN